MSEQPKKLIETIEDITGDSQKEKFIIDESITPEDLRNVSNIYINPDIIENAPERMLTFNDAPLLWRGCKAFVCGVSKARKTTYLTLITSILCGRNEEARGFKTHQKSYKVLYVDTEQARYNSQNILLRVAKLCNKGVKEVPLKVMPLFDKSYKERRKLLECGIVDFRPDVVILDNWTDCVSSVNDERECVDFSEKLRILADYYNLAIYSVIHANEGMRKEDRPDFRGWAKEEGRKSDITTFLKDEGNYSSVSFRGRLQTPDGFCIGFDDNGLPAFVDADKSNETLFNAILEKIPATGLKHGELSGIIEKITGKSKVTAGRHIKTMLERCFLTKTGEGRNTTYFRKNKNNDILPF